MTVWSSDDLGGGGGVPLEELLGPLDARPGPARRLSSSVSSELVQSVLATALAMPAVPGAELATHPVRPAKAASRWGRVLAAAAGVLLAISAGSGASAVALRLVQIELGSAELTPSAPAVRAERRPPPARSVEPAPRPPEPVREVVAPPVVVAEPEPIAEQPTHRRVVKKKHSHRAPEASRQVVAAPAPSAPPAPAPSAAPTRAPGVLVPENLPPSDLLAHANERLKRREWRAADIYYYAVSSRFAGTDAAIIAEVASAGLHLQHLDDPTGALASYQRTLAARPSGPLAEEARWGIAEARRTLGDPQAEAQALRSFLAHHPDSAFASTAQRRLARLAATPAR